MEYAESFNAELAAFVRFAAASRATPARTAQAIDAGFASRATAEITLAELHA